MLLSSIVSEHGEVNHGQATDLVRYYQWSYHNSPVEEMDLVA